jgi:hypothetical protein
MFEFVLVDIIWRAGRLTESCVLAKFTTTKNGSPPASCLRSNIQKCVYNNKTCVRDARRLFASNTFYVKLYSAVPFPVAARLLRSWVRILPWAWMFVHCMYCVLSGRGLCDELITRPKESYRCGASLCVIKKPRGRGDQSPRLAAEPEKIINK